MNEATQRLRQEQRDAIWKWRWLGWRKSTPGFKGSMAILGLAGIALIVAAVLATR